MKNYSEKIEYTYRNELLWSKPINYKGITLYPVTCENILEFNSSVTSLVYDPLRYPTEISTLPRLYFLTDIHNYCNDPKYLNQNIILAQLYVSLVSLLKLVLRDQKFTFIENNKKWFLSVQVGENSVEIKAKDFEIIRQIILVQNGVHYDDTFIHEDIRQWIEEQEQADKTPKMDIEDRIEAYMIIMKCCDINKVKQVPLRQFNRILDKAFSREHYCGALSNPMFDGKINHWVTDDNKGNSIFDKYFKEVH